MRSKTYYYDSTANNVVNEIYKKLTDYFTKEFSRSDKFVLFCIGTDRITGDSLGPLVGYKLKKFDLENVFVYGTLDEPIHALNIEQSLALVKEKHPNLPIIAVDASLGHSSHLGCITVSKEALKPGIGVKKKLKHVGDISITGIVCSSSPLAGIELQTTRLSVVMKLADCICDSLLMMANSFLKAAATKE